MRLACSKCTRARGFAMIDSNSRTGSNVGLEHVGNISIKQLRAAALVAETLSYVRAAERLGYTEPAVHHQIKRLQDSLSRVLFIKKGRGLALTSDGASILPKILDVLESASALLDVPAGRENVCIAAGTVTAGCFLADVLASFKQGFPSVEYELSTGTSEEVAKAVRTGEAEIGLALGLPFVPLSPNMILRQWITMPFGLFADQNHRERSETYPVVFVVQLPHDKYLKRFPSLRYRLSDVRIKEVGSVEAVKSLVGAGLGLGLLPVRMAATDCAQRHLVLVEVEDEPLSTVWICHGPRQNLTMPARALLRHLGAYAGQETDRPTGLELPSV